MEFMKDFTAGLLGLILMINTVFCAMWPLFTDADCDREQMLHGNRSRSAKVRGVQTRDWCRDRVFRTVCLDRYVLETAYYQYRQQYGVRNFNAASINEQRRYVAYRQLARWCWGYLGKEARVVFPVCAVTHIRDCYPSKEYRGYQDV